MPDLTEIYVCGECDATSIDGRSWSRAGLCHLGDGPDPLVFGVAE